MKAFLVGVATGAWAMLELVFICLACYMHGGDGSPVLIALAWFIGGGVFLLAAAYSANCDLREWE